MRLRSAAWVLAVVALAAPPVDGWLDHRMPRLLLLQMPAWFALGWLAGRRFRTRTRPPAWDPHGLTGLVFALGTIGFWMIPRSVDLIGASELADQLMHLSLLAAGAALAMSAPRLSFVLRAALGIYGASMTFALGMLYSHYAALLCGAFDIGQQKTTGHYLIMACPVVVLLVLGLGARSLAREGPPRRAVRPAQTTRA